MTKCSQVGKVEVGRRRGGKNLNRKQRSNTISGGNPVANIMEALNQHDAKMVSKVNEIKMARS